MITLSIRVPDIQKTVGIIFFIAADLAENSMKIIRTTFKNLSCKYKNKTQQQILIQKAQLKMQEKMNNYRVKAMDRAEEDYQKTKLSENYMDSSIF